MKKLKKHDSALIIKNTMIGIAAIAMLAIVISDRG